MDKRNLAGKCGLVTGAADGLGLATATLMAQLGGKVMLVDIDAPRLEKSVAALTQQGLDVAGHVADVSDENQTKAYVAAAKERFGRIDGFFNNAGILPRSYCAVWETPTEEFDLTIAVNLRGVFLGLKHVIPIMIEQGGGAIVNTASMGAAGGIPGVSPYVTSKHGVIGLTKNAALEAAEDGVRVNAILPGNIVSRMSQSEREGAEIDSERLTAMIPNGRLGSAMDIARAVCFLFSDAAIYITGIELPVDGGILAASYGNMMAMPRRAG